MEKSLDEVVGESVALYRFSVGMSQGELAQAMTDRGVPVLQQTVAKIEAGSRPLKLSEAAVMTSILNVEIGDLFDTGTGINRVMAEHLYRQMTKALEDLRSAVWRYETSRVNAAAAVSRVEASDVNPIPDDIAQIRRYLQHRAFNYEVESSVHVAQSLGLLPLVERDAVVALLSLGPAVLELLDDDPAS